MTGVEFCSLFSVCTFLFVFAYLSYEYVVIFEWLTIWTWKGFLNFLILQIIWFQMMYNYYKVATTDPGIVPKEMKRSSISEIKNPEYILERSTSLSYQDRYCRKCKVIKPPRAHHCSDCKRCVLKMDHHCIWVNNCVGYHNHKYFLLFLIYLTIEAIQMIVGLTWCLVDMLSYFPKVVFNPISGFLIGIQLIIIIPTFLSVLCLCIYQIQLVGDNTTNIELLEKEAEQRKAKKRGETYHYPYDRGFLENLKDVFGKQYIYWFFPTKVEGDGITFMTNGRYDEGSTTDACVFISE